ncbi:hypothetical protein OHA21_20295 [Actinoplanes sp. NBC_00393]|uniref:hypothetical protein n=1 Tax=Actinoplanes sp. NBC_00393 TaxID=2975953 RepID=UPI002E1D53F0
MGNTRPERQAPLARSRYVAAARRFVRAYATLLARGVPIDPGRDVKVRDWTAVDVAVLRELHEALGQMLDARREWDGLRRHR